MATIHRRLHGAREEGTVMSHNLCGAKEGNFYIDVDHARILDKCYLLTSITGYCLTFVESDAETLTDDEDEPAPTLERLEMVKKALSTGYAFPTNYHFVTNNLWQEFQEAIRQRKGGFSREQFVHPSICRREHYKLEVLANSR